MTQFNGKTLMVRILTIMIFTFANYCSAQMINCSPGNNDTTSNGIQTLFNGNITNGVFCGPSLKIKEIKNIFVTSMGVRAAWVIDHRFTFGAAGYGLMSRE